MKKLSIIILSIFFFCFCCFSQTETQIVKGTVVDKKSKLGLIGASIVLVGSNPIVGTTTDLEGRFVLDNIPVGRQTFEFRMLGYNSSLSDEILIGSGKEVILEIAMEESSASLNEVAVVMAH